MKACVELQKEYLLVGSEWGDLKRLKCPPFYGKGSLKLWKHQRTIKTAEMSRYSLMLKHKAKVLMSNISAVMEMLFVFVYCGLNTLTLYQGDYCSLVISTRNTLIWVCLPLRNS